MMNQIKDDELTALISLEPRKKPTQKRSRERVDSILDACAELLDEVGPDGVNTNTIADRARIPVSSLYQYFPNKHAVLIELMSRQLAEIDAVGEQISQSLAPDAHWKEICDDVLNGYLAFCEKLPGFTPLWHTIQAHPDLYQISSKQMVDSLTSLRNLFHAYTSQKAPRPYSEEQVRTMQHMVIETAIPTIGRASRLHGGEQEQLMEEIRRLIHGYLREYLGD